MQHLNDASVNYFVYIKIFNKICSIICDSNLLGKNQKALLMNRDNQNWGSKLMCIP